MMRCVKIAVALVWCGIVPLAAQYRDYYLYGRILDIHQQPLAGVEVTLVDTGNSLSYVSKTNQEGKFKFIGLPHGTYEVTVSKPGYDTLTTEWKFTAPQEKMLRVEIPDITLATGFEAQQIKQNKQIKKDLDAATEMIRNQDYDGALDVLKKILQTDAKNPNALYLSGLSYLKKKMYPEAEAMLQEVTVLSADFPPAHFQLGVCYQQLGKKEKALEQYREVVRLDPKNMDNYFNAALILIEMQQSAEAMQYCAKILEVRPDDPDVNEMAARCQLQLGDYPKALAYFEKTMALTSDEAKKKDLSEIIASLQKTIQQK